MSRHRRPPLELLHLEHRDLPSLTAAPVYDLGRTLQSVATADLSGDLHKDLVVANSDRNNVSVLLANSDGSFKKAVSYSVGGAAGTLAIADFNGDKKLDIAVNLFLGKSIKILPGIGSGKFGTALTVATDLPSLFRLASGDFDKDGKTDLVATGRGNNEVQILLNQGKAKFDALRAFDSGGGKTGGASSIAVGDFNRDGKLDLAFAHDQYRSTIPDLDVFNGKGHGLFTAGAVLHLKGSTHTVVARDLDADGVVDLAVSTSGGTGSASIYRSLGNGSFRPVQIVNTGRAPQALATGDMNGDGKIDLVVAALDGVRILLGKGKSTYQAAVNYAGGSQSRGIVVGDFDRDGKNLDVATIDAFGHVIVMLGTGGGALNAGALVAPAGGTRDLTTADFNGDGRGDLAILASSPNRLSVLLGRPDGTLQSAGTVDLGHSYPDRITSGDFNHDGKIDLTVSYFPAQTVSLLLGKGDGTFEAARELNLARPVYDVRLVDLNGDGAAELVVKYADKLAIYHGNADGELADPGTLSFGLYPIDFAFGDFNGDGKVDVAAVNESTTAVSVRFATAPGVFGPVKKFAAGVHGGQLVAADLNGDGHDDLVLGSEQGVRVLLARSGATFSAPQPYLSGVQSVSVAVGDINGDGKPDLLFSEYLSDTFAVLDNTGNGTFKPARLYATGVDSPEIFLADVDGNEKLDVVLSSRIGFEATVMLNK